MKNSFYLLLLTLFSIAGCKSTYVTSSWKADVAKLHKYDKILVLGIISDSSRAIRQVMEKELVDELRSKGITAVSAFEEYGPKAFKRMSEEQMNEQIKKKGFDGVITISLLDRSRERYYVPGEVYYTPFGYGYGYFWGYYSTMYDRLYQPGYYETVTNYLWESNLFDLSDGKLIYSVQSNSFDPESLGALGHDYSRGIVKDLMKNGLLTK